ncbi:MAG TPA: hypothetical protein VLF64_00190 [Candidatus Saccharimonadales bacterium]|nr:hypothetical protein [Candidatus Chromulinivoraceae bacterium]HSW90398.1 hypothetical protein [Candidatus Saccharimonadales bacterium]
MNSEYDGEWKVYVTTSVEVILHARRANTYRTVTLAPINKLGDVDEQRLDANQLYQFVQQLPNFAHKAGYTLPDEWRRFVDKE